MRTVPGVVAATEFHAHPKVQLVLGEGTRLAIGGHDLLRERLDLLLRRPHRFVWPGGSWSPGRLG
jgi:hypothetical protein